MNNNIDLNELYKTIITMRFRLLLVALLLLPILVVAQDQNVRFYSKGKMYVKYRDADTSGEASSTSLHVEGSMKFASGTQIEQKGRTQLTGDFINALDPTISAGDTIFVNKTGADGGGVIAFIGNDSRQAIKRSADVASTLQKALNPISFPTIKVEQTWTDFLSAGTPALRPTEIGFLVADTSVAMIVDKLDMAFAKTRFRVESGYNVDNNAFNAAHVKINNLVDNSATPDFRGFSEVHLNYGTGVISGSPANVRSLTGFSPPFSQMGSDYLFYQVLLRPNAYSITSFLGPEVDPFYKMEAGRGYFMAQDVLSDTPENLPFFQSMMTRWNNNAADRQTGNYVFSRRLFQDYYSNLGNGLSGFRQNFNRFTYDPSLVVAPSSGELARRDLINERFNVGDVEVKLTPGLNFLGNPFMAPISLNSLINWSNPGVDTYTVPELGGVTVTRTNPNFGQLRPKYWVVNRGEIENKNNGEKYAYLVTYDYVSIDGSTTVDRTTALPDPQNYLIAPMQMFCLQASQDVTIKLTPSLIKQGNALMPKSNARSVQSSNYQDWFVLEAEAELDQTTDRTSVGIRDGGRLAYNESTDTKKGLLAVIGNSKNTKSTSNEDNGAIGSITNLLYTKSSDGVALLGNVVPANVKELPLYYIPPTKTQRVKIRPYGLDFLQTVKDVWLVDKYENKEIKLTPEAVYEFIAQPLAANETLDNRFILRFKSVEDEIIKEKDSNITCYYNSSTLYISGLVDTDMNSNVQIYDLQGRLVGKSTIKSAPSDEYFKPLSQGTYIVRIAGQRNYTTKFVNLQ